MTPLLRLALMCNQFCFMFPFHSVHFNKLHSGSEVWYRSSLEWMQMNDQSKETFSVRTLFLRSFEWGSREYNHSHCRECDNDCESHVLILRMDIVKAHSYHFIACLRATIYGVGQRRATQFCSRPLLCFFGSQFLPCFLSGFIQTCLPFSSFTRFVKIFRLYCYWRKSD